MNIKAAVEKTIQDIRSGAIEPGVTYAIRTSGRTDTTATTVVVRDYSFLTDVNPSLGDLIWRLVLRSICWALWGHASRPVVC